MDITSKLSISFSPEDAEELVKKAVLDYLQSQYGFSTDVKNVKVSFKASLEYDYMDRGTGSPVFSGVEVTVAQPAPPTVKTKLTNR